MNPQGQHPFGSALEQALSRSGKTQAELARLLGIDAGQVSRWKTSKALPTAWNVQRMSELLGIDLTEKFLASRPEFELYVAAPIIGLEHASVAIHHDAVAEIVAAAREHVNGVYWPGENITDVEELAAPDLATEKNMRALAGCEALLYVQLEEVTRPTTALIELGIALGRRMKTTIIIRDKLQRPFSLSGSFDAVAARTSMLPEARSYIVRDPHEAVGIIGRNGRNLLGLN